MMENIKKHIHQVFGVDLRTLALFRVCIALVIIGDLINRSFQMTEHYTDIGIVPRSTMMLIATPWDFSLHMLSGDATYISILFIIHGLFALGLLFGFKTRWMVFACWLLGLSLQNRNYGILIGGDNLITLLLFWSFFLPLGARFSIDEALNPNKEYKTQQYFSIATLALMLQVIYVYAFGALLKTHAQWIPDGTAVHYTMYGLFAFESGPADLLRALPWLLQPLTYFVYFIELLSPIFLFSPIATARVRIVYVSFLICMHIGFGVTMIIGLFPFISITSLLVFTPKEVWEWLGKRLGTEQRKHLKIYYDQPCGFCQKTCFILRSLVLWPGTQIIPAQTDPKAHEILEKYNSWVVVSADNSVAIKTNALAVLFKHSPIFLFRWLGHLIAIPFVLRIGDVVYHWVTRNRGGLGNWSSRWLPEREVSLRLSRIESGFVAVLTAMAFYHNLLQVPKFEGHLLWPSFFTPIYYGLQLDQRWNMFAPYPYSITVWLVHRGVLMDGTVVDVRTGEVGEPSYERPESVFATYGSYRSVKLPASVIFRGTQESVVHSLNGYAWGQCNLWNVQSKNTGNKRLVALDVYSIAIKTPPPGQPEKAETFYNTLVKNYYCQY